MKSLSIRVLAAAVMALIAWVLLAAATAPQGTALEPDKLIILSTTDVKGEVAPCG
ncbi:MAG TPA: hypothetical protein VGK89_07445 [Candidatus Eisenbacteria bacterium]|jgi:hypothetical protein